jgi:cell division protein FtsQ
MGDGNGSRIAAARDRFAQRRRRGRVGRWRTALLALGAAALAGGCGWVVLGSDVFDVDDVTVEGTAQLSPAEVERAADVPSGEPLARVDLDAIGARVERLPAVDAVQVVRDWPGTVRVVVTERQAVAGVQEADHYRGLDADGVVFRSYGSAPAGLPLVQSDELPDAEPGDGDASRDDALREVARVVEALPRAIARRVEHVELASLDSIALVLSDGSQVRWGSAEESDLKADVLTTLMSVPAMTYDVSVPGLPTTTG